jgi:hypothetical protein
MEKIDPEIVRVAHDHFNFQSSYIAPGDANLTYREVGYWPGSFERVPCDVIVVSRSGGMVRRY